MKVKSNLAIATKRCLHESLAPEIFARIAKEVLPGYDLPARTGFPATVPVPGQLAAARFVDDVIAEDRFLILVERLARLDREGFMGRPHRVDGLQSIMRSVAVEGYVWDETTELFMEDSRIRRTPDWGRLLEGEERRFTLLRADVVKNSRLVRVHGEAAARGAFEDLRNIFSRCVEHRQGRVWRWEGDGALAAFLFGHSTTSAVLAGISLLNELFLYDRMHNSLGEPLKIRAAVHTGPLRYSNDIGVLCKQETIMEVADAEANQTPVGALSMTPAVAATLDRVLLDRFHPAAESGSRLHVYEIKLATP